jgi:hypothetical protein
MERSLLNEITDVRLSAYLKKTAYGAKYWPALFPLLYRDELTWETLQGEEGANIKADIVSYDSSAPEKGRETIEKIFGKIAKMSVKRAMREEDFLMYRRLKKGVLNDDEKQAILDMVFNDVDFVVNSVLASNEYLALQIASTGQITLTKDNNVGLITNGAIDMGVPTVNKKKVNVVLTGNPTTFDFLAEVRAIKNSSRQKGVQLNYMFVDSVTLDLILDTTKVREAYGYLLTQNGGAYEGTLFLEDVNKLMKKSRLPEIVPIDSLVRFENRDHQRTNLDSWKPGYITFSENKELGRMQHGPIAEEDAESVKKYAVQAKKGHILVTKWSEVDPVREWTKGEAHCFPVLRNPNNIWMLNTNSTTTFI